MVAKLDLRIPGRTKSKTEAETGLKHYLVFAAAAAFLFTVLAVLLLGGWKLYSLHNEKLAAADEKNTLTQNSEIMDKEYARLNGEASSLDARLSYMLDDIPAVEVLTTLDTLLPNGVVLESVSISGGKVTFKGSALVFCKPKIPTFAKSFYPVEGGEFYALMRESRTLLL